MDVNPARSAFSALENQPRYGARAGDKIGVWRKATAEELEQSSLPNPQLQVIEVYEIEITGDEVGLRLLETSEPHPVI